MISQFSETEFAISLPITGENRKIASQFAARQPTRKKAKQVLLNTIAVSVVNNYLTMLDIATDLASSDSWNPVMQLCNDTADLQLPGVGILECRPIENSDLSCRIPLEVWDSRIGYVVVRIDDSLRRATILGFTPQVTAEELDLTCLRPPEALIDRIHELKTSIASNENNLSQWLDRLFTTGWEAVENLLAPEQLTPAWGFRSFTRKSTESEPNNRNNRASRAKLIDLGLQLSDRQIVLLVEIQLEDSGNAVTVQLHPSRKDLYLPEGLELKVLEASGEVFMRAQARSRDNYIQLLFSGQPGEIFDVQINLNDAEFTERFKL